MYKTYFAQYENHQLIENYKKVAHDLIRLAYPLLTELEIDSAIDWSISKRLTDHNIQIDNNYKKQTVNSTLLELTDYIFKREPILTASGVIFKRHGEAPNPIYKLLDGFLKIRKVYKKEMFKYPKGSEMFEKYNLMQLLAKIDANGFYGVSGAYSSIYYNLYLATTTTTQAKLCNCSASLFFESFLNNNVPNGSMNQLMTFIHNVCTEERFYKDEDIIDENISVAECFYQLISATGFGWIPSEEELEIIWNMLCSLRQEDINRLFYKNNLYNFCDNTKVQNTILNFLSKLTEPYMNPNSDPMTVNGESEKIVNVEAKEAMDAFYDLLFEYVYYGYGFIDTTDKMNYLIRSTNLAMDTDSTLLSLDGWYRYELEKTIGIPMTIKQKSIDALKAIEDDGDPTEDIEYISDYDFVNDELIETKRFINPCVIIPQDGLRFSIINLMSNILGRLVNDFIARLSVRCNVRPSENRLNLKNEFLYDRFMLTDAKKHYAGKLRLQEGNIIEEDGSSDLDIKGMEAFVKSSMAEETRTRLKKILYEDILKANYIDQLKVLKDIAIIEKEIYDDINSGSKKFYKPVKVKSQSAYADPMRIQGIKASCAYNSLHEPGTEAIDLSVRNSLDIIKVEMTPRNINLIKDSHPYVYEKALELFKVKEYATGIDSIAIPLNEPVPDWVLPFVKYAEIINLNVGKFPLESIGIHRGNPNNNGTNIISF